MKKEFVYIFENQKLENLHKDVVDLRDSFGYGKKWVMLHNLQSYVKQIDIYQTKNKKENLDVLNFSRSMIAAIVSEAFDNVNKSWFFKNYWREQRDDYINIFHMYNKVISVVERI